MSAAHHAESRLVPSIDQLDGADALPILDAYIYLLSAPSHCLTALRDTRYRSTAPFSSKSAILSRCYLSGPSARVPQRNLMVKRMAEQRSRTSRRSLRKFSSNSIRTELRWEPTRYGCGRMLSRRGVRSPNSPHNSPRLI